MIDPDHARYLIDEYHGGKTKGLRPPTHPVLFTDLDRTSWNPDPLPPDVDMVWKERTHWVDQLFDALTANPMTRTFGMYLGASIGKVALDSFHNPDPDHGYDYSNDRAPDRETEQRLDDKLDQILDPDQEPEPLDEGVGQ